MKTLFDYQQEDLDAAIDGGHKSVFIAYEMALGKTLWAVEFAKAVGVKQVLILAPKITVGSWRKTVLEQIPGARFTQLSSGSTKKALHDVMDFRNGEPGFYFMNWELMRTGFLSGRTTDMIIGDEIHVIQNFGGSNTAILAKNIHAEYKVALSGTPSNNNPKGIFGPINWLWPERYPSLWRWVDDFWRTRRNGAVIDLVRELEPGGVVKDLPFFRRRLKRDHRGDLPPVFPEEIIEVDLTREQWKIYNRMAEEAGVWLGDEFLSAFVPLVTDIRLRQIALGVPTMYIDEKTGKEVVTFPEGAKSSKMDKAIELIQLHEGQTFLIYTHSARFVNAAVAGLNKKGIKARGLTGETSDKEKDELLETFGTDFQVLVGGIAKMGTGLDGLQEKCSNLIWLSKHPDASKNKQAQERLDRPGQKTSVRTWYIMAPGTVDERSKERLEEIEGDLTEMLDTHR